MNPRLGYYEPFKDDFPKLWQYNKLDKTNLDILSGFAFKSEHFSEKGGIPLIRVRDVGKSNAEINYTGKYDEKYLIYENNIIIGMDGNYVVSKWNGPKSLLNQRVCKIESVNKNRLNDDYLYYTIQYPIQKIETLTPQTTVKHLSSKDIRNVRIPFPPIVEQRGIVEVLGTVDECIRLTDEAIERAEELKRGLMQRLLTRGIGHTEFKQTPLGEIPKTWKIIKLNEISDIFGGSTPSTINPEYWNGSIPFVTPSDITSVDYGIFLEKTKKTITEKGFRESSLKIIPKGSILLTSRATIGECLINEIDVTTNQGFANIMPEKNIDNVWLLYYLKSQKRELERLASGSTFKEVSRRSVRNIKIILPPLNEQNKISKILTSMEQKASFEQEKNNYLLKLQKGSMQILLSGKVRVEMGKDGLRRVGNS